jgi:hypothetical protein
LTSVKERQEEYLRHIKSQDWYDSDYKPIPKPENWQPETKFREDHRYAGKSRCLAWSGRTGEQCKKLPIKGREKCKSHGGTQPRSIDRANYKHGRYTKSVAGNPTVAKAYEEALKQRGILNLSPNIAMTDARLDLLYQEDIYLTEELIEMAESIYQLWLELKQLIPRNNPSTVEQIIQFDQKIKQFIKGIEDKEAFNKREDQLTERRRRLTETETKRQTAHAEVVLKAEAIGIFAIMGNLFRQVVLDNIEDKETAQRVIKGQSEVIDTHIVGFFSTDKETKEK